MKATTKVKIKNTITKLAKRVSKRELAISILFYYHLHVSNDKPVGSEISVNTISKAFGLNIGTETTIEINKVLLMSQMVNDPQLYLAYIAEQFVSIMKKNKDVF